MASILYKSLKRLLSYLLPLILFQVMLNLWCKDRACYIVECQNSNIQFTILTVIFYLHAGAYLSWNSPFPLASPASSRSSTSTSSMHQCMWGWMGRSQCSGLSQAQVQRVLCLSLGPRPSSPQQQIDYITATFNLV